MSWRHWLLALWLFAVRPLAQAHPLAPALLQLQAQPTMGQYAVLWRTSVTRTQQGDVAPVLPADCRQLSEPQVHTEDGDAVVAQWRVQCAGPLTGQHIAVQGLAQSGINVIVHLADAQGGVVQTLLGPDRTTFTVPAPTAQRPVFFDYLQLGVEHLLTGFDHLLFVAGLLLLVDRLRPLLLTVTAFTLGHSLTLALASVGLIRVPQSLAELGIALSILVLAAEVARPHSAPPSALRRWPWAMAAAFGLLHGLGFAGALAEVGLPEGAIPLALLAFNLGIELGQLLWLALLLAVAGVVRWTGLQPGNTVTRMCPAYLIGSLAAFWFWDRLAGF